MDFYDEYLKVSSSQSLRSFCLDTGASYSRLYRKVKKNHPELLSRKRNGGSSQKFDLPEVDLRRMYHEECMSQKQIADHFGCCIPLVSTKMKEYGINTRIDQSRYWDDARREEYRVKANTGEIGVLGRENWKYRTTSIEVKFMETCDDLGITYKRQYPIVRGGHQYDFFVPSMNLLVEMDGVYWHDRPAQREKDAQQVAEAESLGYTIVRITDHQLASNKNIIRETLNGSD